VVISDAPLPCRREREHPSVARSASEQNCSLGFPCEEQLGQLGNVNRDPSRLILA
jgi:hypothetical protein